MTITREQVEDAVLNLKCEDCHEEASLLRDLWQRVEELERELALKGSS